jgi:hypothetical protein
MFDLVMAPSSQTLEPPQFPGAVQVGVHALELDILNLQFTQLGQVRYRHAAELARPFVVGRLADAVPPARLADLGAEFDFFQDANDLALAQFYGILYFCMAQVFKEASKKRDNFKALRPLLITGTGFENA